MKRTDDAKRVGIWIRVSTEDQVKGESPEHPRSEPALYAEAKGWNVVEVYRLDALSGKTVKEYPETKRMLQDVKAPATAPDPSGAPRRCAPASTATIPATP